MSIYCIEPNMLVCPRREMGKIFYVGSTYFTPKPPFIVLQHALSRKYTC